MLPLLLRAWLNLSLTEEEKWAVVEYRIQAGKVGPSIPAVMDTVPWRVGSFGGDAVYLDFYYDDSKNVNFPISRVVYHNATDYEYVLEVGPVGNSRAFSLPARKDADITLTPNLQPTANNPMRFYSKV